MQNEQEPVSPAEDNPPKKKRGYQPGRKPKSWHPKTRPMIEAERKRKLKATGKMLAAARKENLRRGKKRRPWPELRRKEVPAPEP